MNGDMPSGCRWAPLRSTHSTRHDSSLVNVVLPRERAPEMLLVTGGAGFIGSNVVADLNEAGHTDIVVNDTLGSDSKWRNLRKRRLADFIPPTDLSGWLQGRKLDAVIHLGAISSTTATDGDQVIENNFRLSLRVHDDAHALHLRVLRSNLRQRRGGLCR